MRSLAFASLLLGAALAQKTQVSSTVYDQLARYARFASASYSSNCANPPFGSSVEKMFNDKKTDTQVTLFRDESAQEYILSFRGTSSVQDFITDLQQDLVSCSAADGISCLGCTVSLPLIKHSGSSTDRCDSALRAILGNMSQSRTILSPP